MEMLTRLFWGLDPLFAMNCKMCIEDICALKGHGEVKGRLSGCGDEFY